MLAGSVARLYWEWQTQAALNTVLQQIEKSRYTIIATDRQLYQNGLLLQLKVWKPILMSAKPAAAQRCRGKMKIIEARLSALTNHQTKALQA